MAIKPRKTVDAPATSTPADSNQVESTAAADAASAATTTTAAADAAVPGDDEGKGEAMQPDGDEVDPGNELVHEQPLVSVRSFVTEIERHEFRDRRVIACAIPSFDALLAIDGMTPEVALAELRASVARAAAYLREVEALPGQGTRTLPQNERGPFRVTEAKQVMLHGGITTITVGTIVSVRDYGFEGIRALREQGVKMVPVET